MKLKDKEKITDALENLTFKIGMMVKIKRNAIKNGLLKEKCEILMGKKGIVISVLGVTTDDNQIEVMWKDDYYCWIIPKESLDIIRRN